MVIFNSYVKLPEGTIKPRVFPLETLNNLAIPNYGWHPPTISLIGVHRFHHGATRPVQRRAPHASVLGSPWRSETSAKSSPAKSSGDFHGENASKCTASSFLDYYYYWYWYWYWWWWWCWWLWWWWWWWWWWWRRWWWRLQWWCCCWW